MQHFECLTNMPTLVTFCFLLLLAGYSQGFRLGSLFESEKSNSNFTTTNNAEIFNNSPRPPQSFYSMYNTSLEYSQDSRNEIVGTSKIHRNTSETDLLQANTSQTVQSSTSDPKSEAVTSTHSKVTEISTELSNTRSTSKSSIVSVAKTESKNGTISSIMTPSTETNGSSTVEPNDEQEKVVIGKPIQAGNTTTEVKSKIRTLYIRAVELISDTYTLSILLPVAAGVVFASTIILTIATCRCIKRKCRQSRMRRKVLPDSVKHLRPSDRARLLAESSDEEF